MRIPVLIALVTGCGFDVETGSALDAATIDAAAVDGPSVSSDAGPNACPAGYGPINGVGRYRVIETSDNAWSDAAADCNDDDDGGAFAHHTHLLVLGSDAERLAITANGTTISGNTWIGLSDRAVEGTFAWVTGEPTGGYPMTSQRPPWDQDDPDNAGGEEDCVRFKNGYVLEDKPCDDELSYVCECDTFAPL